MLAAEQPSTLANPSPSSSPPMTQSPASVSMAGHADSSTTSTTTVAKMANNVVDSKLMSKNTTTTTANNNNNSVNLNLNTPASSPAAASPNPSPNPPPVSVSCSNCATTHTPLWRRSLEGSYLCNACGLYLKVHRSARPTQLQTGVVKSRHRSSKYSADGNGGGSSGKKQGNSGNNAVSHDEIHIQFIF